MKSELNYLVIQKKTCMGLVIQNGLIQHFGNIIQGASSFRSGKAKSYFYSTNNFENHYLFEDYISDKILKIIYNIDPCKQEELEIPKDFINSITDKVSKLGTLLNFTINICLEKKNRLFPIRRHCY